MCLEQVFSMNAAFQKVLSFPVFSLFADIETVDGAEIAHDSCPYLRFSSAGRAFWLLAV